MNSQTSGHQPMINLSGLCYRYPGADRNVIDHLDFQLFPGDRVGVMAPNGSGKTTLFYLLMGLLKPSDGQIEVFGEPARTEKDFERVRRRMGLLFQDADDQLFSPTVLEDVAFGPLNLGKKREDARSIAMQTLKQLGLNGYENKITFKLSGGEKRLVSLATVLSMEPEVLLLDEPGAGLDEKTKSRLVKVLLNLDLSFILISHDTTFLYDLTDSVYTMSGGKLQPAEKMHVHPHVHPHTSHSHHH